MKKIRCMNSFKKKAKKHDKFIFLKNKNDKNIRNLFLEKIQAWG